MVAYGKIRLIQKNRTNAKKFIEWHDISFDTKASKKREIDVIVRSQVSKFVRKVFSRPYVIDVEVDHQKQSINRYTNVPLANIRMRQAGSLNVARERA